MASAREMRMRIRSVKNISQVTRALEAVSASKVRKAVAAVTATRAYATKAWQVLTHIASQPGRATLHPLLARRPEIHNVLVVVVSGDRGLAGAYNTNIIRFVIQHFDHSDGPGALYRRRAQRPRYAPAPAQAGHRRVQPTSRLRPPLRMFRPSAAWRWMNS